MTEKYNSVTETSTFAAAGKALFSVQTGTHRQQTPLVSKVYKTRQSALHNVVDRASKLSHKQLLILGAGLDVSYSKYAEHVYFVDYENVLSDCDISRAVNSSNIHLIAADITDTSNLELQLSKNGFNNQLSSIVLIECVLCYIRTEQVNKLLQWICSYVSDAVLITYDPFLSLSSLSEKQESFGRHILYGFHKNGASLKNCHTTKCSSTQYINHLRALGWSHIAFYTMEEAETLINGNNMENKALTGGMSDSTSTTTTHTMKTQPLSLFDEYAGNSLINQHYAITICCNDSQKFDRITASTLAPCSRDEGNTITSTSTPPPNQRDQKNEENEERQLLAEIRLLHRLGVMERRLHAMESSVASSTCNATGSGAGSGLFAIEKAPTDAASANRIADIYQECFAEVMSVYPSVCKFGNCTIKELRKANWGRDKNNQMFWVACLNRTTNIGSIYTNATGSDERKYPNITKTIIGCIGLSIRKERKFSDRTTGELISETEMGGELLDDGPTYAVGEISNMCVLPAYRRMGVATLLLQEALEYMENTYGSQCGSTSDDKRRKGKQPPYRIDLSTVQELYSARMLYTTHGFKERSIQELEDGCKLWYMSLTPL